MRFDLARKGRFDVPQARVVETLGNPDDQRQISLIAVHAHGIPDDFPEGVHRRDAEELEPPTLQGRTDLRDLPLVTIDPVDARDHDDAVHAEPDTDPQQQRRLDRASSPSPTSRITCAPARGSTARRSCAATRSISPTASCRCCPRRISNDLCSLREGEERAVPRRAHGVRQARRQEAATPSCAP